jgi:dephospho-CoA kinase
MSEMASNVIGLSGPRACGKSTIAGHLEAQHGYTRIAFADALRGLAEIGDPQLVNDRLYLARLGEKLRELLPDFVLQVVQLRLDAIEGPVVIEDLRFPAELNYCNNMGATTVRLEIPVETQIGNLADRGTDGAEAELLINCQDEYALTSEDGWQHIIPAVGDFKILATEIHELSLGGGIHG